MEKDPWWQNVQGPFPTWKGPKGVKPDGGGSVRGQGRVGRMLLHRAVFNRAKDGVASGAAARRGAARRGVARRRSAAAHQRSALGHAAGRRATP
jgi:hypothetical protein